jgi:Lrp/AsnC family leucine-responsive transcriptional regulator
MRRLLKDRLVISFGAPVDPHRLSFGLLVFVAVPLNKTMSDVFCRFAAAANRALELRRCHMVADGFGYLVKTLVRDVAAYRSVFGKVLLTLLSVRETRIYPVMEEVKSEALLPL